MNKAMTILFLAWTVSVTCAIGVLGVAVYKQSAQPIAPIQAKPTMYDIVLECQKLSAMTTKKDWGYKDCLKELQGAVEKIKFL